MKLPRTTLLLAVPVVLALLLGAAAGVAWLAGVDLTTRQVPEVRRALGEYEDEDYARAAELLEQGRTDLEPEQGKLWLDRGLALARLSKNDEAAVALRRAAGDAKAPRDVRSDAHFAMGNLALGQHRNNTAIQELRQALRLDPDNRDAAWNLSLAHRRLEIDACKLVEPTTLEVVSGQESDEIIGEVLEAPRTGEDGAYEGLKAQIGVGLDGSDPRRDEGWHWKAAEYSGESEEGGGERWAAKVKAGPPGVYDYAYRFKQPGGDWAYCDIDGSNPGGYSPEQAGNLIVTPPGNRCQLLGPAWLIAAPGEDAAPVEVAVAIEEAATLGEVEVGFGPDGSQPAEEEWTWQAAEAMDPTVEAAGSIPAGSARYRGRPRSDEAGRFDVALRFRPQGEEEWIHCDLNGSEDGFAPQAAVDFVVREMPSEGCLLDRPPRTQAAPSGPTEPIRALVLPGGESTDPLRVEIGVGPDGSSPGDEGWTWVEAESADPDDPAFEVPDGWEAFAMGLTAPDEEGSFDYAVRVGRGDEPTTWTFCDLDGSVNDYSPAMSGELLVQESQGDDQQEQQDEEEEQDDEEEQEPEDEEEEQDDEEEQEPEDEEEQEPEDEEEQDEQEEEAMPEDMESVLDALQQNERTFLPPRGSRPVRNDW